MTDSSRDTVYAASASGRTSAAIAELAREAGGKDISLGTILAALKDRGFGIFIILFALPNAIIPGLSFLLGAPVVVFALQLAAGQREVWLPGFLRRRTIPAALFARIAHRAGMFLIWAEKRLRPRWSWIISRRAERFLGIYMALVAAFLMMPVPFGNALPALGISLMAAGLIEADGVTTFIGIVLGFLGIAYIFLAVAAGFEAIKTVFAFF